MKRLLLVIAASVVTLALPADPAHAQERKQNRIEQAITKLENDWAEALLKGDQAAIDRIVAPEWTLVGPDGKVQSKAQADSDLKAGTVKFESFKLNDLKVSVFKNTAVAQGLETEKSSYKGKDTSGQYRFTDVFIKRDGRWQAVATQITRVEAP
jgi:ketosteroid isomerase-like protein